LKPPSRDNHRKTPYLRVQQHVCQEWKWT